MKLIDSNASFIGFHFFKNSVHPILSKISLTSLFINFLSCHKKILYDSSFIENESHIGSS
jgi:hypothetical protein